MALRLLLCIVGVCLVCTNALGEGPPMDADGNVTEDHIVIIMTEAQLEQEGAYRILDLTDEQHTRLKKMCDVFPKMIWTLTPHYAMCTCELTYGIWNRRTQVAIPHRVLESACAYGRKHAEAHTVSIESRLRQKTEKPASAFWKNGRSHWMGSITIDHEGIMHSNGAVITRKEIRKLIANSPAIGDGEENTSILEAKPKIPNTIFLSPPPSIDEGTDARVEKLIEDIEAYAAEKSARVVIGYSF